MTLFEEGFKLLEEKFGNGKDNLISLATVSLNSQGGGNSQPVVREVDAHYEDGVFYVMTNTQSCKMQQIAKNPQIAFAVSGQWFTGVGIGENLGWVMKSENAELRTKLRKTFAAWYDMANNEKDENCCILAIRITKGTLNINHWEKLYHMDFVNKTTMDSSGVL
ncbi:MAG TPA: pyridoxamine 5'-phosphate oxidase family protein [Treponemataceae bacterium]|nr:pyridoxamine 5'-phosphate oxidase family protein [Treponemataceae bacterium]